MGFRFKIGKLRWAGNDELIYSICCTGIAASLIFWPLLNSLICIGLFAYWLVFTKKRFSFSEAGSRWLILFGLIYLNVMIGTLYSGNKHEAYFYLQQKSAILLFPLVFATSTAITPAVFKRTCTAFTWSTFAGCGYCLLRGLYLAVSTGKNSYLQGHNLVTLKNMQPFMMGLCCLLSLIFLFNETYNAYLKQSSLHRSLPKLAGMAVFIFFIFLLSNRSIFICMCGVFLFYCYKLLKKVIHRFFAVVALAGLFALSVFFNPYFNYQWNDLVDFSDENSIHLDADQSLGRSWGGKALRISIWKCSWDIISANWLTGVGSGDVQAELQRAYEKRQFYFASRYNSYNAHNQYIQETLAHGIIGLLIFLACVCAPLVVYFNNQSKATYVLFLLCFAFICITESLLELNKGIIWYSFFNSIFIFRKA